MKYEVQFHMQRNGGTYSQTFENYTQAWRYGEILRKRNKPFIINLVYDM